MNEQPTIHTERVDDVPLLLAHMQRLALPTILDTHFPGHGNHQGLRLGWLVTVWLAHILSRADHRLNRVRPWADQLPTTLNAVLPQPLRPTDLTDDRFADARAHIHHAGDAYLCPLGKRQLPAAALDDLITQALASGQLRRIRGG